MLMEHTGILVNISSWTYTKTDFSGRAFNTQFKHISVVQPNSPQFVVQVRDDEKLLPGSLEGGVEAIYSNVMSDYLSIQLVMTDKL